MKRVAVVEDNPDNRLLIRVLLEPHYELAFYETGAEALAGLLDFDPRVILMDISLPDLAGPEVLAKLREDPRFGDRKAIACTAHAMDGDREDLLAKGFDAYLSKPIEFDELLAMIQRLMA